jgi:nicotinate phosphoribosyltransferase
MAIDLRFAPSDLPLLVDLYELTMAASYFHLGMHRPATFTLSVRRLPPRRGFLVAAGIERFLEALSEFHFEQAALDFLDSLQIFTAEFLAFLGNLRFTGEVRAMPEGTLFFAEEPLVEITAPLIEAQLLETLIINQVGFASLIASKAVRSVIAARGRRLIDFGLRRSHGADAGLMAARSCYLAGFTGTSNVLAGQRYGIPLYGTMAHSYVMAHDSEREAFGNYSQSFPQLSTLLVDTYETMRGVENAAQTALELRKHGYKLQAIRLDSGDLAELSVKARNYLDRQGLQDVAIFASGNLDEYRIDKLLQDGAALDAFGVGTAVTVSNDTPALDIIYKLTEYAGVPRMKTSINKASLPGRKQVFRACNARAGMYADLIGLESETALTVAREFKPPPAEVLPLLEKHVSDGQRVGSCSSFDEARNRCSSSLAALETRYKDLDKPQVFPVKYSAALNALLVDERIRASKRQV